MERRSNPEYTESPKGEDTTRFRANNPKHQSYSRDNWQLLVKIKWVDFLFWRRRIVSEFWKGLSIFSINDETNALVL
jgi:hypothetical protein